MVKISASILNMDWLNAGVNISRALDAGADWLHFDVMDGMFVPNISFGPGILSCMKKLDTFRDVHLMIESPERYISDFVEAGADSITIHAEATRHIDRTVQLIKSHGIKVGIALNPATPVRTLEYVIDGLDMVLIMTVNPGFGGQKLIEYTYGKVAEVNEMARRHGRDDMLIQVDGGVNVETAAKLRDAGANVLVVGSALFNSDDPSGLIRALKG